MSVLAEVPNTYPRNPAENKSQLKTAKMCFCLQKQAQPKTIGRYLTSWN